MKRSLYRDRDYAFGQTILTLRTKIGLTQTELADLLGVTRRAVGDWEGGLTYPKAEHLKQFVILAVEQQAFPAGCEAEEVRALWQAARQGELYVWDANDGTLLQRLVGHQGPIKSVAWSPDGVWLVSAGRGRESGELLVWDAQHGEQMYTIAGHPGIIYAVVWGMSGKRGARLVSGGSDGTLRWWSVDSEECLWVREAHQGTVHSLKVSPDGCLVPVLGERLTGT